MTGARPRVPPWLRDLIAAALSGAMLLLSFPPYDIEPLAWAALVPLMFLALRAGAGASWKIVFLWSALLGTGLSVILISWLRHVTPAGWLVVAPYLGCYFVAFALLFRYLTRRLGWAAAFVAPPLWTALELARGWLFTGFGWFLLGHSQYLNLPFIQAADVISAYGLGFVIVMANGAILDAILRGRRAIVPVVVTALVVAATFCYGWVRLSQYEPSEGPRICLVQGNVPISLKHSHSNDDVIAFVANHVRLSLTPEGRYSDLIIWPETIVPVYLNWAALDADHPYLRFVKRLSDLVQEAPRETHKHLLVGSLASEGQDGPDFNSAYYFSPDGRLLGRYDKMHLVVFGEFTPLKRFFPFLERFRPKEKMGQDLSPGREAVKFVLPWQGRGLRFATTICYEDTVPSLVRRFARPGLDFMVNISNDGWFLDSPEMDQHMAICVFRAVETRLPIARASNTGVSSFIEPTGRIQSYLHRDGRHREVEGVLAGSLKLSNLRSPYLVVGDAFPNACAVAAAVLLILAFLRGGKYN